MSFKQKLFLDKTKLKSELESLLKLEATNLEIHYQSTGSTGAVNKITLNVNDSEQNFLLKKIEDYNYYNFYSDILLKSKLNHPEIYGVIKIDKESFLLMQWIENIKKVWEKEDYMESIEWLARKDKIFGSEINKLRDFDYIKQKENYLNRLGAERIEILTKAAKEYDSLFVVSAERLLEISEDVFSVLNNEPLTLVHNDYCKNNILITEADKLFVIDWTGPFIASIGIDLSEILNDSPKELQSEMLSFYTSTSGFQNINEALGKIRLNSQIGHITWRMKRLLRGDDKYEDIEQEIRNIMINFLGYLE